MKKVNKIKKTTKKVVKTVKKAGTKVINKATSKIKTIGKKANAIIAAGKEAAAKAKKEKADRKAAAKEALCKNQEFLESQKKSYSDPTYDYKDGYPRTGEVWAFDANGNIDKEKSAEVSEQLNFWNSIAAMAIPGPGEIIMGKVAGTIVVKVGGKVGSKIISWGATKFATKGAAKGAAKEVTEEATKKAAKKASEAVDDISWSLNKNGAIINGRKYSGHALERMAPDTPAIRAQLNTRAQEIAKGKGYVPGTKEYNDVIKGYIQPRNVPPLVVEDTIKNGVKTAGNQINTWKFETGDVTVIINDLGDVITVIPK